MADKNQKFVLQFEKPVIELEKKIEEMRAYAETSNLQMDKDIQRLEEKAAELRKRIFSNLNRWQRVQLARHPQRPYTQDYIDRSSSQQADRKAY